MVVYQWLIKKSAWVVFTIIGLAFVFFGILPLLPVSRVVFLVVAWLIGGSSFVMAAALIIETVRIVRAWPR